MRIDAQLLSLEYLKNGFTLSSLWGLRESLNEFKSDLEGIKEKGLTRFDAPKLIEIETKLSYLQQNIDRVERIMVKKEEDIFIVTSMSEICLN